MKTLLAVTLVVTCLCVHFAAAGPNWDGIKTKIAEIKQHIIDVVKKIQDISKEDNKTVGEAIEKKIEEAVGKGFNVLGRGVAAAYMTTLTADQAKKHTEELIQIFTNFGEDIKPELAQLKEGPSKTITDDIAAASAKVAEYGTQIAALFAA